MTTKTLYLVVTLTTDDDDSILSVDSARIHLALCKGFPFMPMSQIDVVEVSAFEPPEPSFVDGSTI